MGGASRKGLGTKLELSLPRPFYVFQEWPIKQYVMQWAVPISSHTSMILNFTSPRARFAQQWFWKSESK